MYVPASVSKYARGYQGPATQAPQSFFALTTMMMDSHSLAAQPFGLKVFNAFDKARFDAEQTALCLVAGAPTAAVFHMMRVVEWGVRALGADLGLRKIKRSFEAQAGRITPRSEDSLYSDRKRNLGEDTRAVARQGGRKNYQT